MEVTIGLQWLIIGAIILTFFGMFVRGAGAVAAQYDESQHEAFAKHLIGQIDELRAQVEMKEKLFQALVLADDFYSEMTYRKNRIRQLSFEMRYIDNDFTEQWTRAERDEIAMICEFMLREMAQDYIDNIATEKKNFAPAPDSGQEGEREKPKIRIEIDELMKEATA